MLSWIFVYMCTICITVLTTTTPGCCFSDDGDSFCDTDEKAVCEKNARRGGCVWLTGDNDDLCRPITTTTTTTTPAPVTPAPATQTTMTTTTTVAPGTGSSGTTLANSGCVCPLNYNPFCCDDTEQFGNGCLAICAGYNVPQECVQEECAATTTANVGNARSIEKEQDMGYDVVDSGDEVKDGAADSQDLAAVLAASFAFVAVVVIGMALFYAMRTKEENVVVNEMIVKKEVSDVSVEMVTEAPITV